MQLASYRALTYASAPLMPLWLRLRMRKGKEDRARLRERFGYPSIARPPGTLLWMHAASVGEAMSVLLLLQKIRDAAPHIRCLLTTGTVTSARLLQTRLPKGVIHQYLPVDTPQATARFIRHWKPDIAFWVESELWPNLVAAANEAQCFTGLINARMSERSFTRWQKHPGFIHALMRCFNVVFAQSDEDAQRFQTLGASLIFTPGNLKYDAALLPCDESELHRLQAAIGNRPVWLAASTHPGEEEQVAAMHAILASTRAQLLTIIVPRHPERGASIAEALGKQLRMARRAANEPITEATQCYIADTLGELGLFYRLCERVFMGGSLVAHGGQNPLEPARLACAIVSGPHVHNFSEIYREMDASGACVLAKNSTEAAARLDILFNNSERLHHMQDTAQAWIKGKSGAAERMIELLMPILRPMKDRAA